MAFPRAIGLGPFRRHRQPGEDPAGAVADSAGVIVDAAGHADAYATEGSIGFEDVGRPAGEPEEALGFDDALAVAPGFGYRSAGEDVTQLAWRIPQRRRLAMPDELEPVPPEDDEEPVQGVRAQLHAPAGTIDPEIDAKMPRWRRPSLQEARRADPTRTYREHESLRFDGSSERERRVVRYRLVRMLATPDELHGLETGSLDQGDEVEILEQHGVYRFVQAPDGSSGWVHKMILGEVIAPAV